jgi:hypothetical protein
VDVVPVVVAVAGLAVVMVAVVAAMVIIVGVVMTSAVDLLMSRAKS